MAENTNDTGGVLTDPIDRRSALKKAAVAGAIAWTTPMIISSTAHADHDPAGNGTCTPACAPDVFSPVFLGRDGGDGKFGCPDDRTTFGVPNNVNKFGVFKVTVPGLATCPCSAVAPTVVISFPIGTYWSKSNVECAPYDGSQYAQTFLSASAPDQFAVSKVGGGAVGNGWYTPSNPICISVGCPDKIGGDIVYRKCTFTLSFYYDPDHASCSTFGAPLQTCTSPLGCSVSCDHC